jgi:hypothetical protein
MYFSLTYGNGGPPPPLFVSSNINGPPHQAPLFLADTNNVTILTQLSFYTPSSIDGTINVDGTSTLSDSNENTQNLNWKLPAAVFKIGTTIKTWEFLEIFAVLSAYSNENGVSFMGSEFGLGILICQHQDIRARFDFGFSYASLDMETTLLWQNDTTYKIVTNSDESLGPFVSLTMSSAFKDWIINPFLQIHYYQFPLFSYNWTSDRNISSTITTLTFTPGITYRIHKNILLILGGSYIIPSDIENVSSKAIYSGFLQANFLF